MQSSDNDDNLDFLMDNLRWLHDMRQRMMQDHLKPNPYKIINAPGGSREYRLPISIYLPVVQADSLPIPTELPKMIYCTVIKTLGESATWHRCTVHNVIVKWGKA